MSQGIFNKILNQLDNLEVIELQQLERAIGRYSRSPVYEVLA
ncbi:hypothetical protein QUB42_25905 [Microcoleus sp. Aus8_D1]